MPVSAVASAPVRSRCFRQPLCTDCCGCHCTRRRSTTRPMWSSLLIGLGKVGQSDMLLLQKFQSYGTRIEQPAPQAICSSASCCGACKRWSTVLRSSCVTAGCFLQMLTESAPCGSASQNDDVDAGTGKVVVERGTTHGCPGIQSCCGILAFATVPKPYSARACLPVAWSPPFAGLLAHCATVFEIARRSLFLLQFVVSLRWGSSNPI